MVRVLVAIASHGSANRQFLEVLLKTYQSMRFDCEVFVLSDTEKDLGSDVNVLVGAPTPNPLSLPFAHRDLFRERIDQFDVFIYSEDDTLVTEANIEAFLEENKVLRDNEIAGFLRTEITPTGEASYSTCHSFFRWIPGSVCERGGKLWAKYSNEHSACYMTTRAQLQRAFASGGLPTEPHQSRYDMLCSAATDIYVSCGFERLICIDRLADFTLQHLPNKYVGRLGLSSEELAWQIEALKKIKRNELSSEELFNPETSLPGGVGSKFFHEKPDPNLERLLGEDGKSILVWGGGDGALEASIQDRGHHLVVVPFNAVFGACCYNRGLTIAPNDDEAVPLHAQYDCIVTVDCLQLCDDPGAIVSLLARLLRPGGTFIARVPNLNRIGILKHRVRDVRSYGRWGRSQIGAHPLSAKDLRTIANKAGLQRCVSEVTMDDKWQPINRASLGQLEGYLAKYHYLVVEKNGG